MINLFFKVCLFAATYITSSGAEEVCGHCGKKDVEEIPYVKEIEMPVMISAGKAKQADYPFDDYLATYCMQFGQIDKNELNQMIRDLSGTPYPVDEYFLNAGCKPHKVGGVRSPLLHLTAEAPCSRVEYPQIIHKYYTVKRKNPKIWLKIVNAKNSLGETFLDYIEILNRQNEFNTIDTKECASQLIEFACKTGAIYSKFSSKTCSPSDYVRAVNLGQWLYNVPTTLAVPVLPEEAAPKLWV